MEDHRLMLRGTHCIGISGGVRGRRRGEGSTQGLKGRRIAEELGRIEGRGRGRREEVGWREESVDREMGGEKREGSKREK